MNVQTKKQRQREKKHEQIIALYNQLSTVDGSRMEMWKMIEKKCGYSIQGIMKVLKKNGIEYQKR